MRRCMLGVLVVALAVLAAQGAAAQIVVDLTPVTNDFQLLFSSLGEDTLSRVQQFGLIMDGTGRAEVGKGLLFAVSGGAVFFPGIGTIRETPDRFSFLGDVLASVEAELPAAAQPIYEGSKTFFLDPGLRLSAGFALARGIEVWGHFGIVPQAVANLVGGLPSVGMSGLVLNRMNAGGRVRLVLVHDQKGLPAVSLGVGYTHTQFNMGLESLSALDDFVQTVELIEGFTMSMEGSLYARTRLDTAGVELAISKKLAFIAPFLRLGAWYQWARYAAGIEDADGNEVLSVTLTNPTTDMTLQATGTVKATELKIHDLSFVAAGGLELVLGKLSLILQGSYDTASATPAANATLQLRI